MEDLLNERVITPYEGFIDVYVIVGDYIDMRIDSYAVYDWETYKILNTMKEVVSYASKK